MGRATGRNVLAVAVVALAIVASSCSSGHDRVSSPSSSGRPAPSSAPPSSAPELATASLTFRGDDGFAGPVEHAEVTCSFPAVGGLQISVFASAAGSSFSYRIGVVAEKVIVQADTASGTFHERNFEGRGVSGFDARRGARLDTELTDAPPSPGVTPGSIGRVTGVTGTITCGDQKPGSSTLTVSGDTAAGRYDRSPLDPVVVECYFADTQITAIGVALAGGKRLLMMVSFGPDGLSVEEALGSAGQRNYAPAPGSAPAAFEADGGRANGDVVERDQAHPHTLHIEGAVRCGAPIRS